MIRAACGSAPSASTFMQASTSRASRQLAHSFASIRRAGSASSPKASRSQTGSVSAPIAKLLYHCDSNSGVWVYDVRPDRTVSDRRLFAKVPDGAPDGMTVDTEGCVWAAIVMGPGEIVRFKPDGAVDRRVKVPAKSVTSVAFGGPDMCDLYAVTANNTNDRALKGSVFRARSDIPGLPVPKARF